VLWLVEIEYRAQGRAKIGVSAITISMWGASPSKRECDWKRCQISTRSRCTSIPPRRQGHLLCDPFTEVRRGAERRPAIAELHPPVPCESTRRNQRNILRERMGKV
jgi:hypothetical protein